jgi:hypothetical protein
VNALVQGEFRLEIPSCQLAISPANPLQMFPCLWRRTVNTSAGSRPATPSKSISLHAILLVTDTFASSRESLPASIIEHHR